MLKKRTWRKSLAVAVTAGILASGYSTALAAEYNQTITGSDADTAYVNIIKSGNVYDFGPEGASVMPGYTPSFVAVDVGADVKDLTLKAAGGKLYFRSEGSSWRDGTTSFAKEGAGTITIDAANTKVEVYHTDYDGGGRGIQLTGDGTDKKAVLNVKGNLEVGVKVTGTDMTDTEAESVYGIYAKENAEVNIDGNYSMAPVPKTDHGSQRGDTGLEYGYGERTDYSRIAALYAGANSQINVKGNVNMTIKGSGLVAKGANSSISIGGGTMKMDDNAEWLQKKSLKNFYIAAAADGGTINVNVNDNGSGTNKTDILGDVLADGANSVLNIGLNNAESKLTGVVRTENGAHANLYLGSGVWENKVFGNLTNFKGSTVEKLAGSNDAESAGYILQKESNPLNIANYSGHTILVYEHQNDGTNATDFAAGDTHIGKAAAGSGIVMSTDNSNIDTNNMEQVNKVLNNLAGKLYYDAYKNGEKNLSGTVQIASGLTGSSASKVVGGDMTFSETTGQGKYDPNAPKPPEPPKVHVFDKQIYERTGSDETLINYWGHQNPHLSDGTMRKEVGSEVYYNFMADSIINVDANKGVVDSVTTSSKFAGIDISSKKNVKMLMNGNKLTLNVNGVHDSGFRSQGTTGIKVNSGSLVMQDVGGLEINMTNGWKGGHGIHVEGVYGNGFSGNASLTIQNGDTMDKAVKISMSNMDSEPAIRVDKNSGSASLNIEGMVDINVNGGTDGISMKQGTINIGGGTIISDKRALDAYGGVLTMNAKYDDKGNIIAADKALDVNITGSIRSYGDNKMAIGLNTADSTFTGTIHAVENGKVDMLLSDGALWTNKITYNQNGFAGSTVNNLVGGATADKAGYIFQSDSNRLNVNNYSGHTVIVYEHTGDGSEASHFAAGDTHIKKAAECSSITMSTDNNGINTDDQDLVNKVLNNLAGKLYYDAYTNNERNLDGIVQIASGLTGSSVSKVVSGDIAFNDKTGQGYYGTVAPEPPAPPVPPENQTEVNFTESITGSIENDKAFVDAGVLKDNGEYVFEKDSNITLTGANSALNAKQDVVIKAEGSTLNFVTNAGENAAQAIKNAAGKNINITADKTVVKVESTSGGVSGIYMSKGDITVNGALDVTAVGSGAQGVYANSGNHTFNGDVKITVDGKGGGCGYYGATGLYATSTMSDSKGSTITVNGMVDISGNGNGIFANAGGSSVTVQGGKIVVNDTNNNGYSAIRAENGVVNMNAKLDEKGNLIAGNGNLVDITGDIVAGTGAVNSSDKNGTKTAINLALNTKDSKLHGLILNEFPAEGKPAGSLTFTGETNLVLQNGATWINESAANSVVILAENQNEAAKGSFVNNFIGGKDMASAGVIVQKDANALTIGNYSGHTYLVYEHTGDGTNATDFVAGDTHIKNAATGSGVTMVTDNINGKIDVNNIDQVSKVLNNLAGKLYYDAFANGEKNLTGKVQISSGLTGSSLSQSLASGDIDFGNNSGQGNVVVDTIKPQPKPEPPTPTPDPDKPVVPQLPGNISAGDYETLMMYGARAAMIDSMVAWRDTSAESFVRTDELRKGAGDGAWARINRGKIDYSGAGTQIDGDFYGVQAGFDKTFANGWTAGMMFDYRDGDSNYKMGSEGEHKMYGMGFYGTKDLGSNDYIDLAAKFGNVENDFTARNEIGKELKGEYSANAYSLSAQYGKRFEDSNGGYFEPQAQLTWSHVDGDNYDARCGEQVMNIEQTAFDSLVGRIGMQAGQITDKGQAFVRLSLAHEFAGDIDGVYMAKDGGLKTTQYNAGDTWSELTIGGNYNLSKCANFYADITKTLTGDYKQDWKFNAGMSFSF